MSRTFCWRGPRRDRKSCRFRIALGAARSRIVRQLLTESLLLALMAGAVGVAGGAATIRLLVAYGPATVPRLGETSFDLGVLLFCARGLRRDGTPLRHGAGSPGVTAVSCRDEHPSSPRDEGRSNGGAPLRVDPGTRRVNLPHTGVQQHHRNCDSHA
jgi:hypothetical protein